MMSEQESKEPIGQFTKWHKEASTRDGRPSARVVRLRAFDKDGFKFVSNLISRKAIEIEENSHVAILFYWPQLDRTIRIEGNVMKLSEEESEKMFGSFSGEPQVFLRIWYERGPTTIESTQELTERFEELKEQMKTTPLSKPPYMGLYCVVPEVVEFLNADQLFSDRIVFRRAHPGEIADGKLVHQGDDSWVYERLAPW